MTTIHKNTLVMGNNTIEPKTITAADGTVFASGQLLSYDNVTGTLVAYAGGNDVPGYILVNGFTMPAAGNSVQNVISKGNVNATLLSLPGGVTVDVPTTFDVVVPGDAVGEADAGNTGEAEITADPAIGGATKIGTYVITAKALVPGDAAGALGGETGNGTITAAPAVGANAKVGVYSIQLLGATTFTLTDPDGVRLEDGEVDVEYTNSHLTFTIAAGGTAFDNTDTGTVTVEQDGAIYSVVSPEGVILADAEEGVAYENDHLAFEITNDGADTVIGDFFTVVVDEGTETRTAAFSIREYLRAFGIYLLTAVNLYE